MILTIYFSGNPIARFEDHNILCDPDLYMIPDYLKEMGFTPEILSVRSTEAEKAIKEGKRDFILSDGSRYMLTDNSRLIQRNCKYPLNLILFQGTVVGVHQPALTSSITAVCDGYEDYSVLKKWKELYPITERSIHFSKPQTVMIPMRDGCRLATDIYLPEGIKKPLPCVLMRTPYGRTHAQVDALPFVLHGYAVAVQDVRGRHDSEGEWRPFLCETEDGDDTLTAIAEMEWCNGNIGMFGASYLGYTQWAAAASGNPSLKTIVSLVTAGSAFVDSPRYGGAISMALIPWLALTGHHVTDMSKIIRDDWADVLAHRPISEIFTKKLQIQMPFWKEMLSHPCEDVFWKAGNWFDRAVERGGISVPALIETGWFDDNGNGSTEALTLTEAYSEQQRKVIIGAWCHVGNSNYDFGDLYMGDKAIREDLDYNYYAWLEKHLRGRNEVDTGAPVEYYTTGDNQWHSAKKWPPENCSKVCYYLNGNSLTEENGKINDALSYEYNPEHPAPHLVDMSENENMLPADYSTEELRDDYLVFTSEPFKEDTVFSGEGNITISFSTNAPDTDVVVRLLKVDESGRSVVLSTGLLSLRFREGFSREVFAEEGVVYTVKIKTSTFSAMFSPGERLRLSVTSSAENLVFPNPNTKEGLLGCKTFISHNQVHFGKDYPSYIELRKRISTQ